MSRLDELRSALTEVDRQLLTLVARRRELALEIGREKHKLDRPTRDFAREKKVLLRARRLAEELGVPADLAETLLKEQIRASLTVQEQDKVSARAHGEGRRVLVIGGAGKMGRWFVRFLEIQGYDVDAADPLLEVDWRDLTLDHDLVVVAAPLEVTAQILAELATRRPRGVVFDVGSLKTPLRQGLLALRDAGVQVTSVHPMFGPDTELLSGRHVIFVDVGCPEATEAARALFSPTMATLVDMDLDSHDQAMAFVLGLSHALNIAFFTALSESGEAAPALAEISSTTFDAQLRIATAVSRENPDLYYEIQALNRYGIDALDALCAAADRVRGLVADEDQRGFVALMESGRSYLAARGS